MLKSYTQQRVEALYDGKDIRTILVQLLEKNRGKRNLTVIVAAELDVSDQTITNWTRDLDIDIDDYKQPVPSGS